MAIKGLKLFGHISAVLLLTMVTQIGGLVYLFSLVIAKNVGVKFWLKKQLLFIGLYIILTLFVVPLVAPIFGREKVKHTANIEATNYMTVLLNRNYVKPELNALLYQISLDVMEVDSNAVVSYLDASFPFMDGFPLLPHLSHNDGRKIDLSLMYADANGKLSNLKKSISGYGVFAVPFIEEFNQTRFCKENGYFQYDFPKYLTFGQINKHLLFSEKFTKYLANNVLKQPNLGKMFIEPHLKKRLNLYHDKVRFHGCGAVRHDDHIHIQL